MQRSLVIRIMFIAVTSCTLIVPAPAFALTIHRAAVKQGPLYFQSEPGQCSGSSTSTIALPSGAERIRVISPLVGMAVNNGRVRIAAVTIENRQHHPTVQWLAEGYSSECNEDFGESWSAEFEGRVKYRQRLKVVLRRSLGKRMVAASLNREFDSTFEHATKVIRFACRRASSLSLRCKVAWFIGDTSYRGWVRVQLGASASTPFWSYVLRMTVTDDYCQAVTHAGDCSKSVRHHKRGIRLSWATL
jgi:hypothetical protein